MEDGRTCVTFESGADVAFKQISMHTLKLVPAEFRRAQPRELPTQAGPSEASTSAPEASSSE